MTTEQMTEEALKEFDEYNANACGVLYPNRNSAWLKEKLTTIATKSAEEERKNTLEVIGSFIRIEQMTHRVGSHSDDFGGASDFPCDCDKVERTHKISVLERLRKEILTQKDL